MAERLVFRNATLLEEADKPVTVTVVGNQITGVTDREVVTTAADMVLDLDGKTLMPGMFICHFHAEYHYFDPSRPEQIYISTERPPGVLMAAAIRASQALLASGFTSFVGAGCSADIDAQLKMVFDDGLFDGPRVTPASHHLNITASGNDRASWWYEMGNHGQELFCDGPDEFRKAVRSEIRRGAEIIKIYPTARVNYPDDGQSPPPSERGMTRDELRATIEAAHEQGKRVRAHCYWRDSLLECVDAGVDLIDHGTRLDQACVNAMASAGTFWIPTMHTWRSLVRGTARQAERNPALSQKLAALQRDWDNLCKMIPAANDAGVRILLGGDYGIGAPHSPGLYNEELAIFVNNAGVAPVDALRWATVNGAELAGMEGRLGKVEPGYLADLLVVDGDPATSITALLDVGKIVGILRDGRFVKNAIA